MEDGRTLLYYDFAPQGETPPYHPLHQEAASQFPPAGPRILERPSEMRWNPTLAQWTVYSAHRMNRPQLPSRDACPLCPGILELPLPYQVVIFENRSPALSYVPTEVGPGDGETPVLAPDAFDVTVPARGRCDLVVYSENHDGKFAFMSLTDIYALIEAWRDHYGQLMKQPEILFTSIYENKGREAGMTLDHPHGQIYSLSFLPPDLQKQWNQTLAFDAKGEDLWQKVIEKELRDQNRIIVETDGFLAAMPFYARYPYEVHIWAKREGVCDLLSMTPQERRELAGVMKSIASRYENLWPGCTYGFPTLMLMQQLTKQPGAQRYRFHVEFYPLQRSPDKLKYRASIETGTGMLLNDALPENQAEELRALAPQSVKLPAMLFE